MLNIFNTILHVTETVQRYLTGPVMHNPGVYIVMPGLLQLTHYSISDG